MPRYELQEDKSSKFWEIEVDGDSFTTRYGRIGTDGQTSTKVCPDEATAQKEAKKLITSKVRKGYVEVATDAAPKPAASAPASDGKPELETAIFERPEDLQAWQVYGDWLQSQSDVRGELVALEVALHEEKDSAKREQLDGRINDLITEHRGAWLGQEIAKVLEGEEDLLELEWRFGFLHSVKARTEWDSEGPSVEQLLKAVMKSSASRFLYEIRIGLTDMDGEATFGREILAISKAGKRPSVRRVYVGDFEFPDETEISWTEVGSVEKLYAVFPNLEWLKVQGGSIELGQLRHDRLQTLILHTGGLPASAARSLTKAKLPQLHTLEVWLGADEYGGDCTAEMLKPLLDAKGLPKLRSLGLMNAEFTNELPDLLAGSKLLGQLRSLDLSMGTLTDDGADALIRNASAYAHLEVLNVGENALSEAAVAGLRDQFGKAIRSSEQKEYEPDWLYVSVGE